MRRLPALVIVLLLLAGCSDPGGAARREQAAAPKHSPSPPPTSPAPRVSSWWQAPRTTRTVGMLRVRTSALHGTRMKIAVTDLGSHASRLLAVSTRPHGALVGRFRLARIRVVASSGRYGVGFRYRAR